MAILRQIYKLFYIVQFILQLNKKIRQRIVDQSLEICFSVFLYIRTNSLLMALYDNLYIEILKIGRTNVTDGLSYNKLKSELESKGYDFENDCIELAVKRWFFDSFHHILSDHHNVDFSDFEEHSHCNFIMTGDACLKLIAFETSENNINLMKWSVKLALLASILALVSLVVSICLSK